MFNKRLCKCGCGNLIHKIDKKGRNIFYSKGHRGRKSIPKKVLLNLYIKQKLCMQKIGKLLKRHQSIEKISKSKIGKYAGKNHPLWRGGISKLPYAFDFTHELRELIRKRDNYKCQICKAPQIEFGRTFHVHHIDYNKQNSNPDNLITLCPNCHSKTCHKPEIYKSYFNVQS